MCVCVCACVCLCVYVSMCLCVYVSVCKCRCIWPVCVCLLFVCVTYVYVCWCVCVRVRVWLRFLSRQELKATHTGRQQGHGQRQDDRHKQVFMTTKFVGKSSRIFFKSCCGQWFLVKMLFSPRERCLAFLKVMVNIMKYQYFSDNYQNVK